MGDAVGLERPRRPAKHSCSSEPVPIRISSGAAARRPRAGRTRPGGRPRARAPSCPGRVGSFWRVSARATGPDVGAGDRRPLHRERPGRGGLVRVARADEPQVRDRAQGGVVLDRLVGRAVLAEADGVVGPDVDDVEVRQRREPDRAPHVVAERQERRAVGEEAAVVGDAVGDAAHRVLADAEPDVAAGVVGLEVVVAQGLDVREVGLREVRGAAEQLRDRAGQRLDQVLARVAGRDLGAASRRR